MNGKDVDKEPKICKHGNKLISEKLIIVQMNKQNVLINNEEEKNFTPCLQRHKNRQRGSSRIKTFFKCLWFSKLGDTSYAKQKHAFV